MVNPGFFSISVEGRRLMASPALFFQGQCDSNNFLGGCGGGAVWCGVDGLGGGGDRSPSHHHHHHHYQPGQ